MMNLTVSVQSTLIRLLETSQAFSHRTGYSRTNENLAKPQTIDHTTWFTLLARTLLVDFKFRWCWILALRALTFSDGLWLAFTTAATVGYGDIAPSTRALRAFSIVVVLLGLAVLSLVTASVAAMFVETEERQIYAVLCKLRWMMRCMRLTTDRANV